MPTNPYIPSRLIWLPWLPWLTAIFMTAVVLFGWRVLDEKEQAKIRVMTTSASQFVEVLIRHDLRNRLSSLERLARRSERGANTSGSDWEADVGNNIAHQPGYRNIAWLDTSLHIRWSVPGQQHATKPIVELGQYPQALESAERARQTHRTVLSPLLQTEAEDPLLAVFVPVYRDGDDRFDGLMLGVLDVEGWLDDLLKQPVYSIYHGQVLIGGIPVFSLHGGQDISPVSWQVNHGFQMYGHPWTVKIAPTSKYLATIHSRLSAGLLIFGLGFSVLAGWVVHLTLAARLRTRQLLVASNRLATLLENLPGMAYRCINRRRWDMQFVSEGCLVLSGYTKEELERRQVSWYELIHPQDRERIWQSVQDAIHAGVAFESEYRITARDGTEKWVWERGRAAERMADDTIDLEGFITDITARKVAETALRNSETYAKAVVDNVVEAVITIDDHGRIETFNQAAQLMFGYDHGEIQGANFRVLMVESDHSEHDDQIRRYLSIGGRRIIGTGRNIIGKRKDGSSFPIHISVSEFVGRDQRKFVGLIRDLSEQQAAEREVKEHRERLAHIDRLNTLGEMAASIAHEVNQPLTAISMYAQSGIRFLEADSAATERLRDVLDKVSRQAHRAGAVIERVQQMTRRRESWREPINCNALMMEVHKLAEAEARIRDFRILLDLCPDAPVVDADPVQIQQVALNLLRNGMEAMDSIEFAKSSTVTLRTRRDQTGVVVSIIDAGPGVSEEAAERIYKPFSSTKKTGMGLGLSICRSIINAHGGRIGFHNNDAGGATFYFTLPSAMEASE